MRTVRRLQRLGLPLKPQGKKEFRKKNDDIPGESPDFKPQLWKFVSQLRIFPGLNEIKRMVSDVSYSSSS